LTVAFHCVACTTLAVSPVHTACTHAVDICAAIFAFLWAAVYVGGRKLAALRNALVFYFYLSSFDDGVADVIAFISSRVIFDF